MWMWSLQSGDSYQAEPDPQGWHEMIYVMEGVLTLVLSGVEKDYAAGAFAIYSSSQEYSYVNKGPAILRIVRNVVS